MRRKLLLVGGEENQRRLYAQEFEEEGYVVIEAEDGHTAVGKVLAEHPDLVILDTGVQDMDGGKALARALGIGARIPVIVNSAYERRMSAHMLWDADAYVVKSADLTELKRTVNRLLDGGKVG